MPCDDIDRDVYEFNLITETSTECVLHGNGSNLRDILSTHADRQGVDISLGVCFLCVFV